MLYVSEERFHENSKRNQNLRLQAQPKFKNVGLQNSTETYHNAYSTASGQYLLNIVCLLKYNVILRRLWGKTLTKFIKVINCGR